MHWFKTQSEPSALFKQIFDLSSSTVETARTGKKHYFSPEPYTQLHTLRENIFKCGHENYNNRLKKQSTNENYTFSS